MGAGHRCDVAFLARVSLGSVNGMGWGIIPVPALRHARVQPPVFSIDVLRVIDPDPMPYAGSFALPGQLGVMIAHSTNVPVPMSRACPYAV